MLVFVWFALLYVLSNFVIILTRKRELVALLLLSFGCLVTVNVLWLFLTVPWVGMQCVLVVFPGHTHLFFNGSINSVWQIGLHPFSKSTLKGYIQTNGQESKIDSL